MGWSAIKSLRGLSLEPAVLMQRQTSVCRCMLGIRLGLSMTIGRHNKGGDRPTFPKVRTDGLRDGH